MSDFIDNMLSDDSTVLVARPTQDAVFTFSNSGRGGAARNWFSMTSSQITRCLEDLLAAGDIFPIRYEEKAWRGIFAEHLTDDVARTMGAVQTLPLFEILAKVIHYTNTSGPRAYKMINLEPSSIRQTISTLKNYNPSNT